MAGPNVPFRRECMVKGEISDTLDFVIEDEYMEVTATLLREYGFSDSPDSLDEWDLRHPCRFLDKERRYISPCMIPDKCFHLRIAPTQKKHSMHPTPLFHADLGLYKKSTWLWHVPSLPIGLPSVEEYDDFMLASGYHLPHSCFKNYSCILESGRPSEKYCSGAPDRGQPPSQRTRLGRYEKTGPPIKILTPARFLENMHYLWVRDQEIMGGMDYWSDLIESFFEITFHAMFITTDLHRDKFAPEFWDWMGDRVERYPQEWHKPVLDSYGRTRLRLGAPSRHPSGFDVTYNNAWINLNVLRAKLSEGHIPPTPFTWMPRSMAERCLVTYDA
ncbi:uncharacterized protein BO80DRAFT_442870 [Aspergillus ibericus CBS 121593]|uniref:Uncharacterized protein n=1 Tax=Aspergillus ibericus CBS 121593 TaxID=1448316 RepID=A0A395H5N6_9EURO|nr:hypothetical protein BO80DRAFT_442870 [Aspergillus ibericus CBS 121593]RAL03187.1 hypothetical protein BO80DRAFT_442870 [Aspergillus ibericus CBS 121593]